jgi:hypothetical protein
LNGDKNICFINYILLCLIITAVSLSAGMGDDNSEAKGKLTVTMRDGVKIKEALVTYFTKRSKEREFKILLHDIKSSVPRIGEDCILRIGSWDYDDRRKVMRYYPVPEGFGTMWYRVELENNEGEWKVKGINRMEAFR